MGLLAVCSRRVRGPVFVAGVDKTGGMTEEPTPGCTWGEERGHAHDARCLTGPSSAPFVSHPTSRLSHGPWEDGVLSGRGDWRFPLAGNQSPEQRVSGSLLLRPSQHFCGVL